MKIVAPFSSIFYKALIKKKEDSFIPQSGQIVEQHLESSTGATLQGDKQKYRDARNKVRKAKNMMDKSNNQGRIRNQPLVNRPQTQNKVGLSNQDQLADRKKQLQATKEGLIGAAGVMMTDRSNQEFQEGQEDYAKLKNRTGVENTATADREQLMDRTADQNGNITSIEDLRRRRVESEGLANAPLADRRALQDTNREVAANTTERADMSDVDLSDRTQSGRNINLMNQHSHEDRIHEQQGNQLSERREINRSTEREVSQDITNRERFVHNNNERNINDTVDRQSISNENNERTVNNVTERNHNVKETNRRVQENVTESESVSRDITRQNEQNVRENVSTINQVNREQVNEMMNQENVNTTNRERGNRTER